MKFRPLQDRVLIRRIEEEEKSAGGIIIPDTIDIVKRALQSLMPG